MTRIKFFLEGVIETAKIAKEKFKNVVELTKEIEGKLTELNVRFDNVNGVVNELKRVNIIKETTSFSKNQIFVFTEYVNIFLSQ